MQHVFYIGRCIKIRGEKSRKSTRKWSRDRADFDWSPVIEKLVAVEMKEGDDNADYDIGMSREEFLEYLDWLKESDIEGFYKAVLGIQLSEIGLDERQVETLVAHPDELLRIMESVKIIPRRLEE